MKRTFQIGAGLLVVVALIGVAQVGQSAEQETEEDRRRAFLRSQEAKLQQRIEDGSIDSETGAFLLGQLKEIGETGVRDPEVTAEDAKN